MKNISRNLLGYMVGILLMTPVLAIYKINHIQFDTYCCGGVRGHARVIGGPLLLPDDDWTSIAWSRMYKNLEPEYDVHESIDWDRIYAINTSSLSNSGYKETTEPLEKIKFILFTGIETTMLLFPIFTMILIATTPTKSKSKESKT